MTLVSDIDFFGGDATGDEWSESRSEGGDASSGIPSRSTDLEPASDARASAAICELVARVAALTLVPLVMCSPFACGI